MISHQADATTRDPQCRRRAGVLSGSARDCRVTDEPARRHKPPPMRSSPTSTRRARVSLRCAAVGTVQSVPAIAMRPASPASSSRALDEPNQWRASLRARATVAARYPAAAADGGASRCRLRRLLRRERPQDSAPPGAIGRQRDKVDKERAPPEATPTLASDRRRRSSQRSRAQAAYQGCRGSPLGERLLLESSGWPRSTGSTAHRPLRRWSGRRRSCERSRTRSAGKVRQAYLFAGPRGTGQDLPGANPREGGQLRARPDRRRPTAPATRASRSRPAPRST